jgi:hypothetical protein
MDPENVPDIRDGAQQPMSASMSNCRRLPVLSHVSGGSDSSMRNPDAVKHECAECGAITKVNRRTGRLYSHHVPGEVTVCSASGTLVAVSQGGEPPRLPPLGPQPPSIPQPAARPVVDGPSTSVRTVQGGLPGLGKRR